MTFGIPIDLFPIKADGGLKTASHLKWIKKRKFKEKTRKEQGSFDLIDMPNRNDILLGKGRPIQEHHGNIVMRQLVESLFERHTNAKKCDKTLINRQIVDTMKASGRFLKQEKNLYWIPVSDDEAHEKVSKTFGSIRKTVGKTTQLQSGAKASFFLEKRAKTESSCCFPDKSV